MRRLCRLRSIAAHRAHFVRRLSACPSVCLSGSHTLLLVTHSYVSQATHAFLGMLSLFCERWNLICAKKYLKQNRDILSIDYLYLSLPLFKIAYNSCETETNSNHIEIAKMFDKVSTSMIPEDNVHVVIYKNTGKSKPKVVRLGISLFIFCYRKVYNSKQ